MQVRRWCQQQYGKLSIGTLIAVYLVIIAGGVVRSAGAGMGCPDWPRCYGDWIPPRDARALPTDYRTQYYLARKAKSMRWATALEAVGLRAAAHTLRKEASIFRSEAFSTRKAWTEYINRLMGLLSGIGVMGLCVFALIGYVGTRHGGICWLSLSAGAGILIAALLGALVVATHLFPFAVTVHMGVAFLIIAAILAAHRRYRTHRGAGYVSAPQGARAVLWALFALFLLQVLLGTQVREYVDTFLKQQLPRGSVLDTIGALFYVHRSGSLLLVGGQLGLCYWLWRKQAPLALQRLVQGVAAAYVLEALLGAILYYFALAAAAQPLHLVLAFVAYGLQVGLLIEIQGAKKHTQPEQISPAQASLE